MSSALNRVQSIESIKSRMRFDPCEVMRSRIGWHVLFAIYRCKRFVISFIEWHHCVTSACLQRKSFAGKDLWRKGNHVASNNPNGIVGACFNCGKQSGQGTSFFHDIANEAEFRMPLKEITQLRLFIGCDDEFVGKCGNSLPSCAQLRGAPKKVSMLSIVPFALIRHLPEWRW